MKFLNRSPRLLWWWFCRPTATAAHPSSCCPPSFAVLWTAHHLLCTHPNRCHRSWTWISASPPRRFRTEMTTQWWTQQNWFFRRHLYRRSGTLSSPEDSGRVRAHQTVLMAPTVPTHPCLETGISCRVSWSPRAETCPFSLPFLVRSPLLSKW